VRTLVVDASVAVKWLVLEGMSDVAKELYGAGDHLPQLLPDLMDVDELIEPAFESACTLRHPIYDLIYLEAARKVDAQLITADRRFTAKIAGTDLARHVTLLSDWHPE
jgi:predicted nucleic acid-binding protein